MKNLENTIHRPSYDLVTLVSWNTQKNHKRELIFSALNGRYPLYRVFDFSDGDLCEIHSHKHIELIFVSRGELTIQLMETSIHLKEKQFLLINSNIMHGEYLYADDSMILYLDIDDSFINNYMQEESQTTDFNMSLIELLNQKRNEYNYIVFSPKDVTSQTDAVLTLLTNEMLENKIGKKEFVIGGVKRLLNLLTTEFQMSISASDKGDYTKALISDVQSYINRSLTSVSVKEVAKTFHYSPDYINKLFKTQENCTISDYIQNLRLEKAFQMICSTNLTISEIINNIGYNNKGFFYKKFEEKYGRLPAELRESLPNNK